MFRNVVKHKGLGSQESEFTFTLKSYIKSTEIKNLFI